MFSGQKPSRFIAMAIICILSSYGSVRAADEQGTPWSGILHRGLMLYHKGEYTNAFALIKQAVNERDPGPEVHRCLALLRKTFLRINGLRDPVTKWTPTASAVIAALEAEPHPTDGQVAMLAVLEYHHANDTPEAKRADSPLDILIEKQSPWQDWACWEKARTLAEKAWVPSEAWGVVQYEETPHARIGCLDEMPILTIPARAAEEVLRRNPGSYMSDEMRKQVCLYRVTVARKQIAALAKNEWFTGDQSCGLFPFGENQVQILKAIEGQMNTLSRLSASNALALAAAEAKLDEFLWHESSSPRRAIPEYLKKVLEVRGKSYLSPDVAEWVTSLPSVPVVKYEVYSGGE
jgi:hypothetical protein